LEIRERAGNAFLFAILLLLSIVAQNTHLFRFSCLNKLKEDRVMNVENLPQIPRDEIEAQFRAFMRENNCEPIENMTLNMDDKIERFRVLGDKRSETTGAYRLSLEGWPHGWCQNWREGKAITWTFKRDKIQDSSLKNSLTDDALKQMIEKSKAHQAEMIKQLEISQLEASEKARVLFESLKTAEDSEQEYLKKKRIKSYGLKLQGKNLAIPLYDINGNFKSIQFINPDGNKKFLSGTPVKGAFFSIGKDILKPDNPKKAQEYTIFVCEGMATGATIYEITTMPTFAAMNCGNLFTVAQAIRDKYPQHKIIIMADNDHKTEGNPGLKAAYHAKDTLNLYGVIYPDFADDDDGTDWNDYYQKHGEDETRDVMREKYAAIPIINKQNKYKAMAKQYGTMAAENFESFCTPLKGENFLIQNWLPNKSLVMLFAPSGSGKGFVAIDMAAAIACKKIETWHGQKITKHGPVVYLAGEGQDGMRKRCAGISDYKGIQRTDIEIAIIKEAIEIDNKDKGLGIWKTIANIGINYPNPVLVILDTLNCYMGGDENKTVDATAFVKAGKEIMQEFDCAVMIIHHTGQSSDNKGRVRGSSVFKAAMDMELKVEQTGMALTLTMTKSKDTELQKPLVFEMIQIPVEGFINEKTKYQETTCVIELQAECSNGITQNEPQQKKQKTTESELFAKETYSKAACEFGTIIHDIETGADIVAVISEDWRKTFMIKSKSQKDNVKRALYSKARKILLDKNFLFERTIDKQNYDCLTPSDDVYEKTIRINILQRENNNASANL